MTTSSQEEIAFERYLNRCKELHEDKYPDVEYDEEKFRECALEKWNISSEFDKDKFRQKVKLTGFQPPLKQNGFQPPLKQNGFQPPIRASLTPIAAFSKGKKLRYLERSLS